MNVDVLDSDATSDDGAVYCNWQNVCSDDGWTDVDEVDFHLICDDGLLIGDDADRRNIGADVVTCDFGGGG